MTDEFTCPACQQGAMLLRSDKKAVFQQGGLSVKYESFYMECPECGQEVQTEAQLTTSTRNALESWHNKRQTIGMLFLFAVMAIIITSIFVRCS